MTSQEQINELVDRLDWDSEFATALEADPFTTLRGTGFEDLAVAAEQERDRIAELVDRIYRDDEFRQAVERDPTRELNDWGLPDVAFEPVLLMAGAPDEVVERATAEVEAHLSVRKPATVAAVAAVLGTLAFAQQASAASQPAATAQVSPVATAQVSPAATAQVSQPGATVQVSPAVTAQVSKPAMAKWQGVQAQRVTWQGSFASFLRTHSIGL